MIEQVVSDKLKTSSRPNSEYVLYSYGEPVAMTNDSSISYFGTDILGSVRNVTDKYGTVQADYSYDAFGSPYLGNLENDIGFGYCGKFYDVGTGLYDYGFRDYSPVSARFTTQDPIRDGSNWFSYVVNDPVNFLDPDGRIQREADGSIMFFPLEQPSYATGNSGKQLLFQWGTIKANDGTDIEVRRNLSGYRPENFNCHGFTFTNGAVWVQPDQVEFLLAGDGYKETINPERGGIFVQYNNDGEAWHSGKILEVDDNNSTIKVQEAMGIAVFKRNDGKIYDTIIQSHNIKEMGEVKFYKNNGDKKNA